MADKQKQARIVTGQVISDRMDKSRVVLVQRQVKHPLYGKFIRKSTKLHVHDEKNVSHRGDWVVVQESRPVSKTKSWLLLSVQGGDKTVDLDPVLSDDKISDSETESKVSE